MPRTDKENVPMAETHEWLTNSLQKPFSAFTACCEERFEVHEKKSVENGRRVSLLEQRLTIAEDKLDAANMQ
eukprot:6494366-Karenia_brevis.AAC.1